AVAFALIPMASCSDTQVEALEASNDGTEILTRFSGMGYSNFSENGEENLSEISVFHFKGDDFLLRTDVADPYAEEISLPTAGTTRIYCVSGVDIKASEGTKEADLLNMTVVSPKGAEKAPLFYSASADFSHQAVSSRRIDVAMKRSVARIDFTNTTDSRIEIDKIAVEDAPAAAFIFAHDSVADAGTVSYSREFSEPFYGTERGMFTLFESAAPVHVRIIGKFGDSPLNLVTELPSVERNKVYTLQMVKANAKVEGAFTIKEWEEGDTSDAIPSASAGLYIDKLNSSFPQGVSVDYDSNVITVPYSGVSDMKVAFAAPTRVSIASTEGVTETAKITSNSPVQIDGGYISSFNASVHPNNRVSYSMTINIKDEEGRYNFVEIKVLENTNKAFATVEIAGLTWMAFNATSSDPADQVFPIDGLSVEEMYQKNWPLAIGNFFQYGRKKGYSPWTKNDPNGNADTPRNIPWKDPDCMPLPAGYHVASTKEWQQLMPAGTTFPSTYAAGNGEMIKAEIVTLSGTMTNSPSAAANNAKLLNRYIRFESQETGNVLIIPICGMKANNFDEYPGGGRALHAWTGLWIAEDRCLWLFQINGTEDALTATQGSSRWNYDGFMAVRGVKDHE
ncbi:MAG: fibrobacter succinogenes major paralogous domain-containing protein, partial [Muribaculaceae bacterium]|nr:fibrobacter succinogenes major paralogous domain-containing protein [Muribaculaceae bacterium]